MKSSHVTAAMEFREEETELRLQIKVLFCIKMNYRTPNFLDLLNTLELH